MQEKFPNETVYDVVINHDHQHSIWPSYKEPPIGWKKTGMAGSKDECLHFIATAWKNVRQI